MFKKTIMMITVLILSISMPAYALHLICDPQENIVVKYEISLNGEMIEAPFQIVDGDKVRLWYSLDILSDGDYKVIARCGDADGFWSDWSEEFLFSIPYNANLPTPQALTVSSSNDQEKLSQKDWEVYHVSSEATAHGGTALNSFDNDINTHWHSAWAADNDPNFKHPHEIQINIGDTYNLSGFYYLARQDDSWNGTVKEYIFYISVDGIDWIEVMRGTLLKTREEQFVSFDPVDAKYISLVALSEVNGGDWTSAAEINLLGY